MSVSKSLLGVAASVAGGEGAYQGLLHTLYSESCIHAVRLKSQALVQLNCPSGFNDFSLLGIIAIGVGGMILAYFWKDILQAAWEKVNGSG